MILYEKTRHDEARKAAGALGSFADDCRGAGIAVGLAAWIMGYDHPAVLVIDSVSHDIPARGIEIDGRGIVLTPREGDPIVMGLERISAWGRDNMTQGASFCFEWRDAEDRSHDVALVSAWAPTGAAYAHAVECAVIAGIAEGEERIAISDLSHGLRPVSRAISIEPARLPDEVPSDDHVLVLGDDRIRIGDICALERVHEDCYEEYHLVAKDGRYRRIAFGEFDR